MTLIGKFGAGTVNGLIIAANIVTSIAIDHFGLVNTPAQEASACIVAGALIPRALRSCLSFDGGVAAAF